MDAGVGNTWGGFNPSKIGLPTGITSTNLRYKYSYYDTTEALSDIKTLAEMQALSNINEQHRYAAIYCYQVAPDAETQVYAGVDLLDNITKVAGATAPGAFTLTTTSKANGYLLLEWTPSAGANNYDVYVNGSIPTGYSNLTVCKKVILLSAETTYSIYVNAKNDTGNTASNTVSVTTGKSDCITAAITQNIITALEKITVANGYSFTVNTVEQERATERINNRLPMLEVCGPAVTIEDKTTQGKQATCGYSVVYRNLLNDDDLNSDPVTTQSQNIAADIIIALMDDRTLGGNAVMIKITDHYHDLDDSGNTTMFNVIVSFEVETFIDMFNPYKIG
jgi:hypothetical protein